MKFNLKDIVKGNYCYFQYMRAGYVYYTIELIDEDERYARTYSFPIEISDLGNATINNREKAINLMRWIRKAIDSDQFTFVSQHQIPKLYSEETLK
jgi:hypothetical protein